jgi:hypothetical protein
MDPDEIEITVRSLGALTDNPRHSHRSIPKTWRKWLMDELGGSVEQVTPCADHAISQRSAAIRVVERKPDQLLPIRHDESILCGSQLPQEDQPLKRPVALPIVDLTMPLIR